MCVVEIENRGIMASCTVEPQPGMVVKTNTEKTPSHKKDDNRASVGRPRSRLHYLQQKMVNASFRIWRDGSV